MNHWCKSLGNLVTKLVVFLESEPSRKARMGRSGWLFRFAWVFRAWFFFLTRLLSLSISEGIFSSAAVHVFSAVPSSDTSCRASSGQESMHFGSPPHRSQAMAMRFSGSRAMPPYGQAWMHQSQAEHFFSSTFMMPFSDCTSASSGQALMHGASLQNLQVTAALSKGVMRMTRILEPNGVQCSHFSEAQTYSQMPQPVHLKGSTETNLREVDLACCSCLVIGYPLVEFLC